MRVKINYQINEKYIMKKIEIDYCKNKIYTEIIKNYLDPMLN